MLASHSLDRYADVRAVPSLYVRQFVVFEPWRPFSAMAIDQTNEHANAVIKSDGAICITEQFASA